MRKDSSRGPESGNINHIRELSGEAREISVTTTGPLRRNRRVAIVANRFEAERGLRSARRRRALSSRPHFPRAEAEDKVCGESRGLHRKESDGDGTRRKSLSVCLPGRNCGGTSDCTSAPSWTTVGTALAGGFRVSFRIERSCSSPCVKLKRLLDG